MQLTDSRLRLTFYSSLLDQVRDETGNSSAVKIIRQQQQTNKQPASFFYLPGFTPMVKILRDCLVSEVKPRLRNTSASEARGESREEEVAPELPPSTSEPCNYEAEDQVDGNTPKTAQLLFANKKEQDIMFRQELDHFAMATNNK